MTHKYLLITAGRDINSESRAMFLLIGTTQQANRDFLFLTGWAMSHGYYFELFTDAVSDFLLRVLDSLKPFELPVESFQVRDVVRAIKATSDLPPRQVPSAVQSHMRALIDTNYRVFRNLSNPSPALQSKR